MKLKFFILVGILVGAFGLWGGLEKNQGAPSKEIVQQARTSGTRSIASESEDLKLRLLPQWSHRTFIYSLSEHLGISLTNPESGAPIAPDSGSQFFAEFEVSDLGSKDDGRLYHFALKDPKVGHSSGPSGDRLAERFLRVIPNEIFALVLPTGKLSILAGQHDSIRYRFWLRQLERLGLGVPILHDQTGWSKNEAYRQRAVDFQYQRSLEKPYILERSAFVDSWLEYQGKVKFFDQIGDMESLDITEVIYSNLTGLAVRSSSRIGLQFKGSKPLSSEFVLDLRKKFDEKAKRPNPKDDVPFDEVARHRRELGDYSLEDILAMFDPNLNRDDKNRFYFKSLAWMYLNPGSLHEIVAVMRELGDDPEQMSIFGAALAKVGTKESQQGLVELVDVFNGKKPGIAATLLKNVMMVERPYLESENAVRRWMQSSQDAKFRQQAGYTLGVMANKLRQSQRPDDRARSEVIRRETEASLGSAKKDETIAEILGRLGNIGHEKSYELILPFLDSSDPTVRQEAVLALRFISAPGIWDAMFEVMEQDPSYAVRVMAAKSIFYKKPQRVALSRFKAALEREPNKQVRQKIYAGIMAQYQDVYESGVRNLLMDRVKSEPDEQLKQVIQESLDEIG